MVSAPVKEQGIRTNHEKSNLAVVSSAIAEMVDSLCCSVPPRIGFITRRLPDLLMNPLAPRFLIARIKAAGNRVILEHYLYSLGLILRNGAIRAHLNADYFPLVWLETMIMRHHVERIMRVDDVDSTIMVDWSFLNDGKKLALIMKSGPVSRDSLLSLQLLAMLSADGIKCFLESHQNVFAYLNEVLQRTPLEITRKLLLFNAEFTGYLLMIYETEGSRFPAIEALAPEMDYGRRIGSTIRSVRAGSVPFYDSTGRINSERIGFMFDLIMNTGEPLRTLVMLRHANCLTDSTEYLYLEYLLKARIA